MPDLEDNLPPVLESKPASPPPPPQTSFIARVLNVLAMPGHVFEEVRASRHSVWNWLVPLPAYAVSLALFAAVFLSVPSVQKLWTEQQSKMRAAQTSSLADAVKSGTITQAKADEALASLDQFSKPRVMQALALGFGFLFGVARTFWWTAALWFLARAVIKQPVRFFKMLEVVGLASVVAIIGNLAVVALTLDFGKTFGDGFNLTATDFASKNHQTLLALVQNTLNFWLIAVLGTGLARLTGTTWMRCTFLVVTYWVMTEFLLLLLGAGFSR